jgi:hypothetical protein
VPAAPPRNTSNAAAFPQVKTSSPLPRSREWMSKHDKSALGPRVAPRIENGLERGRRNPARPSWPAPSVRSSWSLWSLWSLGIGEATFATEPTGQVTSFYPRPFFFRKVPSWSSVNACWSCSCVFITIGPYHATGSSSGFPETSRKRIPSSPA